jgi:hypothetical protein
MPTRRKLEPDLFEDDLPDPVETATGGRRPPPPAAGEIKRKAGFYLSEEILVRFNTKFYELKLAGAAVDNKSALLEAALAFALDDLERGADSRVLNRHLKPGARRR